MGYPVIETLDGLTTVTIDKGISFGYEPEALKLNQTRRLTRGGARSVDVWGEPTRFINLDISNITLPIRTSIYSFLNTINYSENSFYFYPYGKTAASDIFKENYFDPTFFDTAELDDEQFIVSFWQDDFSMPINSKNFSNLGSLQFLVEEEIS